MDIIQDTNKIKMKNLQLLSEKELQTINGGESFWYRVGQAVGYVAGSLVHAAQNIQHISPSDGGNATWADK